MIDFSSAFRPAILFSIMLLFASMVMPRTASAQADTDAAIPGTVLLRNIMLVDQTGEGKDRIVSILIRDRKLDVITEEEIAVDTVELALDAQQGVVLGKLQIGEPANFMILAGDPREELSILLDTATYARFAVRDGVIVRDRLPRAFDVGEKPKRSGWLAYTPPPLALPATYANTSKWNRWETQYFSGIFLAALVLDRQNWQYQDANSVTQVGDLNEFEGGEIRGLRFGAVGTINFPQPWVYTLFAATNAFDKGFDTEEDDDLEFFDWRVDIPTFAGTTLSVGKQKEPLSLERTSGLIYLPMQERSAVTDALLPARNVGVVLSGRALDERMTWAGGMFNDWLDTHDSYSDSAVQFIGRLTGLPFVSQDESNLLHLGFGMRYTDAKEGLRFATEPEFNQSPNFVDTDEFTADSSLTWNLEASWRKGPFWLLGEYVFNDIDAPALGDPDLTGYYVTGAWALTGEMRGYNRNSGTFNPLPVSRSVDNGGWGAWEVAARWSEIDLTDEGLDGGEMGILSLGLNWWLNPIFMVSANYRWIDLDSGGIEGDSRGFNTRILLMLE
jgi:phosphate-selective porin OprO and OprP